MVCCCLSYSIQLQRLSPRPCSTSQSCAPTGSPDGLIFGGHVVWGAEHGLARLGSRHPAAVQIAQPSAQDFLPLCSALLSILATPHLRCLLFFLVKKNELTFCLNSDSDCHVHCLLCPANYPSAIRCLRENHTLSLC